MAFVCKKKYIFFKIKISSMYVCNTFSTLKTFYMQ